MTPPTERTPATQARYDEELARRVREHDTSCYLCGAPSLTESNHWRKVENMYPYDAKYSIHHMLVLARHDAIPNDVEWVELKMWYIYATRDYDEIRINLGKRQSLPGHFHIHLLKIQK